MISATPNERMTLPPAMDALGELEWHLGAFVAGREVVERSVRLSGGERERDELRPEESIDRDGSFLTPTEKQVLGCRT